MSIPFVCNSLLKNLPRTLSASPYRAHGTADRVNGDKIERFVELNSWTRITC